MKSSLLLCMAIVLSPVCVNTAFPQVANTPPRTKSEEAVERVQASARRLRIQIYEKYRSDRAEMKRRQSELEQVLSAWQERGQKYHDSISVNDWLTRSHFQLEQGDSRLVPLPTFQPSRRAGLRPAVPGPVPKPRLAAMPPQSVIAPQPVPPAIPATPAPSAIRPQPAKIEIQRQSAVELAPRPVPLRLSHAPHRAKELNRATPESLQLRPGSVQRPDHSPRRQRLVNRSPFAPSSDLGLLNEELPPIPLAPAKPPFAGEEQLPTVRHVEKVRTEQTVPSIAKPIATIPPMEIRHTDVQWAQNQPDQKRAPVDTIDATDPSREQIVDKRRTLPTTQISSESAEVQINLNVLGSKIAKYNFVIRDLENELSETNGWDIPRLRDAADAIQRAVDEHQHLQLFYAALPTNRQTSLAQISDPSIALAQFTQRMFEVRILYNERSQRQPELHSDQESLELDRIQQQVETWMTGLPD